MLNPPVYKVVSAVKGRKCYVPVTVLGMIGHTFAVGYKSSTGRHVKLRVKGNEAVPTVREAEAFLVKTAKEQEWQPWPEDWPVETKPVSTRK